MYFRTPAQPSPVGHTGAGGSPSARSRSTVPWMAGLGPDRGGGDVIRRLVPAALVLVGVVLLVSWFTSGSESDHARRAVQSLFVNPATSKRTAHVDSCDQIGANAGARIYLCDVTATNCTRFFQFDVYRESVYGAEPVSAPTIALRHPCIPIHS